MSGNDLLQHSLRSVVNEYWVKVTLGPPSARASERIWKRGFPCLSRSRLFHATVSGQAPDAARAWTAQPIAVVLRLPATHGRPLPADVLR